MAVLSSYHFLMITLPSPPLTISTSHTYLPNISPCPSHHLPSNPIVIPTCHTNKHINHKSHGNRHYDIINITKTPPAASVDRPSSAPSFHSPRPLRQQSTIPPKYHHAGRRRDGDVAWSTTWRIRDRDRLTALLCLHHLPTKRKKSNHVRNHLV
jgi:hypothetical protein